MQKVFKFQNDNVSFDQSNFSASPRIFPRIKIIFKNAKRKKKRKKRESFDRQRGLMEAYPSRYDRSFNFLSGSGANISPPSLSSEGEGISYEVNARKETKILTRFQRWFQPCSRYSSSRALEMELLYESTPYHFI